MNRAWHIPVKVLAGLLGAAVYATPQAYTISARPGVVNYIEGTAYLDGKPIKDTASGRTFLAADAKLSTEAGKAEILLTPGVFLRLGANSEVRMISPTLTDTKVELTKGEAMVEVAELVKENNIEVVDHGATVKIEKLGLYRFQADEQPSAAVFEGKAEVSLNDRTVDVGKGKTLELADLKTKHLDKKTDATGDLYAWSKTRDEYSSASSYAAAKTIGTDNWGAGGGWGYGFTGFNGWGGPGWFWNPAFNSFAWLPGDGAFFSPFGYGYFAPGYVNYAPVVYSSLGGLPGGVRRPVAVPVNPTRQGFVSSGSRPVIAGTGMPYRGSAFRQANANGGHIAGNGFTRGGPSGGFARANAGGGFVRGGGGGGAAAHAAGGSGGAAAHASAGGGGFGGGGGHAGGGGGGGGHR